MNTQTVSEVLKVLEKKVQTMHVPIMDLVETHEDDPFKVLIGTILSARTKDETTAKACKKLFTQVKVFSDLEEISVGELEKLVFPVGFYKTKARNLKKLPLVLQEKFGGVMPETVEELAELPGVGRKTANLVVSIAFKKPAICVDTHVHRIMNRFGYIKTKTPLETEMRLRKKLPQEWWSLVNRIIVAWGQGHCTPIGPKCSTCPVKEICEQKGIKKSR